MEREPPSISTSTVFDCATRIEPLFLKFLSQRQTPTDLAEACQYAVLGSGKRIRPVLTMQACSAVGAQHSDAEVAATALEMIHAFSLAHDDLPSLDNDNMRRGRPSLHCHTSEAMAVLAGDALMGMAFELLVEQSPPAIAIALVRELTRATNEMIAGQVLDTFQNFPSEQSNEQNLIAIHHQKTGSLLRAAVRMGGLCGGASADDMQHLERYAESIGVMFQVVDDLLDVTQTAEMMGKATGKDVMAGKLTWPGLHGISATKIHIASQLEQSLAALDSFGPEADPLRSIAHTIATRKK